jgi:hypothetical protein
MPPLGTPGGLELAVGLRAEAAPFLNTLDLSSAGEEVGIFSPFSSGTVPSRWFTAHDTHLAGSPVPPVRNCTGLSRV